MNQILDYGVGNNDNNGGKSRKYSNQNNFGSGKTPMSDRVVKVFAFLMVILAIALIVSGAYSIFKNKKDTTRKNDNSTVASQIQAEILAELDEITGKVKITVNSEVIISKMIYSWDQEHDNVVSGEKQDTIEEEVVAPYGEHVLHVQVTDEQNNKTIKDFTFNSATGMDTTQPDITLTVTEDKKLLVTATDDTSIAYVTYTWNEDEVVTMTPDEDNLQKFEFELDIPKGKNTIVVVAVDGSESSNAKTTSKVLEGVTKPEINYSFLDDKASVLQIICSHENGIKSIEYTVNGVPGKWQAEEGGEPVKELVLTQQSIVGRNSMTIIVTSVDGTTAEFYPEWYYGEVDNSSEDTQNRTENTTTSDNENTVSNET